LLPSVALFCALKEVETMLLGGLRCTCSSNQTPFWLRRGKPLLTVSPWTVHNFSPKSVLEILQDDRSFVVQVLREKKN